MFEFDIEAPETLRISVLQSYTRVPVDVKICVRSEKSVEFGKDGLNLGFRLYDAQAAELLFEGRVFSSPSPLPRNDWVQLKLYIPTNSIRYDVPCRLSVDCVQELEYWFAERRGVETNIDIIFKQDDSVTLLAPRPTLAGAMEERSQTRLHFDPGGLRAPVEEIRGVNTSLLSQSFRMASAVVSLSSAAFRLHCYRTILGREPEDAVVAAPIELDTTEEKVRYWRRMLASDEFKLKNKKFDKDTERRVLSSLGYSRANTLLTYALRLESLRFQDQDLFFDMLANCVVQNSFSTNEIGEVLGGRDPQIRAFYESVVNLAAEFTVGLARLNALAQDVQDMIARVDRLQANTYPVSGPSATPSRRLRKDFEGADKDTRERNIRRAPVGLESEASTDGTAFPSSAAEAPSN